MPHNKKFPTENVPTKNPTKSAHKTCQQIVSKTFSENIPQNITTKMFQQKFIFVGGFLCVLFVGTFFLEKVCEKIFQTILYFPIFFLREERIGRTKQRIGRATQRIGRGR